MWKYFNASPIVIILNESDTNLSIENQHQYKILFCTAKK